VEHSLEDLTPSGGYAEVIQQPPVWPRLDHQLHDCLPVGQGGRQSQTRQLERRTNHYETPSCRKIRQNHHQYVLCLYCSTDDSDLQLADFFTNTNPGILYTYFRRFLHYSFGDFNSEGENQNRHIYDSYFSMFHPMGFPTEDKSFLK
jgi:hypothetical protein